METEFEQRLREGLRSRAAEVAPDPQMWARVQHRIRRERRFRLLYAGAAVAALLAVAVVVLPGVVSRTAIELAPGVAEQPRTEEVPEPAPLDPDPPRPVGAEPPAWLAELPAEVRATRAGLLEAVESGELEQLRPLLPDDGFTFSYGADGDPIAYWQDRQAEGLDVLGLIGRLLQLPPVPVGEDAALWAWPFAYERTPASLSAAERRALEEAIGAEAMAAYGESETYLAHRLGIAADGTWRYFVAGD